MLNFITGFRESLEAIILITIVLSVINKYNRPNLIKGLYLGVASGAVASILVAFLIRWLEILIGETSEVIEKLWEVGSSFVAAILIATLVYFMIKNGNELVKSTKDKVDSNLSVLGVFFISFLMISREGFEIVLFSMAIPNSGGLLLVILGIIVGVVIGLLIYKSIINVSLSKIFKVTLIYLIIQVGYLVGYGVHEFIELLEIKEVFLNSTIIYGRMYDLSSTILSTKESIVGILLNSTVGWVSSPHILQFIAQYATTIFLLFKYRKYNKGN